jgi:hypothetical protein
MYKLFALAVVFGFGVLIGPAHAVPVDPPTSIPDASSLLLLASACGIGFAVLRKRRKK